ncbi:MAG: hypothetical protein GX552_16725 [Chloroflexi bacterium]|jgi:sugar (pentulose or hexulose) kinase|nr:hypothetical protein [Chloroflexota bacterium]
MALYAGLDVGTTTLSVVIIDVEAGHLLARHTVAHTAQSSSPADRARGRAELDLDILRAQIVEALAETARQVGERADDLRGLGVTGQMHGVALLGPDARPLGPGITWQDHRALEEIPGAGETYLQRFIRLAGGPAAFERMGCLPAAGYLGPTLFWLQEQGQLPSSPATACFIPDVVVSMLCGVVPPTDPTDGGSSGLMDIVECNWAWEVIDRLGLPRGLFPEVRLPGAQAGALLADVAARTGLPQGMPVYVAIGDNQASFLGSVREPARSVALNVGTGAQISAVVDCFRRLPDLDTRYFPGGRYLLVGAGLFGGRSYAYLRDLFRQVCAAFGGSCDGELYDRMTELAAAVPSGSDGLRCLPLFTGSRSDPQVRGAFTGISPHNLTPGHLARALLEGMAELFYGMYDQMRPVVGARDALVGSGNAIRRNALFAGILAERFGLPLRTPAEQEEAATGAALVAAVGAGELADFDAASRCVRYA